MKTKQKMSVTISIHKGPDLNRAAVWKAVQHFPSNLISHFESFRLGHKFRSDPVKGVLHFDAPGGANFLWSAASSVASPVRKVDKK